MCRDAVTAPGRVLGHSFYKRNCHLNVRSKLVIQTQHLIKSFYCSFGKRAAPPVSKTPVSKCTISHSKDHHTTSWARPNSSGAVEMTVCLRRPGPWDSAGGPGPGIPQTVVRPQTKQGKVLRQDQEGSA